MEVLRCSERSFGSSCMVGEALDFPHRPKSKGDPKHERCRSRLAGWWELEGATSTDDRVVVVPLRKSIFARRGGIHRACRENECRTLSKARDVAPRLMHQVTLKDLGIRRFGGTGSTGMWRLGIILIGGVIIGSAKSRPSGF